MTQKVNCGNCKSVFEVESYYNDVICPSCGIKLLSPFKSWLATRGREIIDEVKRNE